VQVGFLVVVNAKEAMDARLIIFCGKKHKKQNEKKESNAKRLEKSLTISGHLTTSVFTK
jgi:hypothetical protein